MGLINSLVSGGIAGIGEAVATVGRVFAGDRAEREAASHAESMASLNQYAAEFRRIGNRTWWDALVDGLNRLPRPLLALGTLGLFGYSMGDPVGFAIRMEGLNLVPDELWYLLGAVVGFFFGARELSHGRQARLAVATQRDRVTAVVGNMTQLRQLKTATTPGIARMEDEAFQRQMSATRQPLSNAAVLEWNRRRAEAAAAS